MWVIKRTSLFRSEFPTSGRFFTSRSGGSTYKATVKGDQWSWDMQGKKYMHFTNQLNLMNPQSVKKKHCRYVSWASTPSMSEPNIEREELPLFGWQYLGSLLFPSLSVQHHLTFSWNHRVPLPSGTSLSGGGLGRSQSAGSAQGSNSPSACGPGEAFTKTSDMSVTPSSISLARGGHHEYRVARKRMDTEAIPASATGVSVLHHSSNSSGFLSPALQHSSARNSCAELQAQRSVVVIFGGPLE